MDVFGLIFMKGTSPITTIALRETFIQQLFVMAPFRQMHLMKVLEG